jgi:hypothetical protein
MVKLSSIIFSIIFAALILLGFGETYKLMASPDYYDVNVSDSFNEVYFNTTGITSEIYNLANNSLDSTDVLLESKAKPFDDFFDPIQQAKTLFTFITQIPSIIYNFYVTITSSVGIPPVVSTMVLTALLFTTVFILAGILFKRDI